MLQLLILQHIFSWHKRQKEIIERHRVKSKQHSCSGIVTWTMCCVLKHIKENQDFAWKTTWLVHPHPPFLQPTSSLEERKMCILRSIVPKLYSTPIYTPWTGVRNTYSRTFSETLMYVWIQTFLFDSVEMPRDSEGLTGLQLGVCGAVGKLGCLLCQESPHEGLCETK